MAADFLDPSLGGAHGAEHVFQAQPAPGAGPGRPRYRPPVGLPLGRTSRWAGPLSFLFHTLLVALIVGAPAAAVTLKPDLVQGAGGAGPAGGGGGGRRGTGGSPQVSERLQYMAPAPAPQPTPAETPPEVVPPVVPPPPEEKKQDQQPVVEIKIDAPTSTMDMSLTAGIGGGTGNDGSGGTGPGSGGGIGSGVGTGRGSATGPGTGGGPGTIYPPTPEFTLIPPLPAPAKVRGRRVTVLFNVDERGNVTKVELAPGSGDSSYDRKLREICLEYRFRPATRWDGTPVAFVFPMDISLSG